ncbi:hypothetical protein HanXRQr2_Chr06g0270491 [Helianthus annuus]|uniref:Uncharacterized protein n=1 Tax=Helianthus annuus TaxID=4232 RepID=A0A9K3IV71_HELAN|nr:hypothetical protein HanXRQr2_Chr06g0270491 [Helianthus annuus]KAJ0916385.1 hypothetical protein HanPSC8_Chr06g0261071 [Helianthus annuus]
MRNPDCCGFSSGPTRKVIATLVLDLQNESKCVINERSRNIAKV